VHKPRYIVDERVGCIAVIDTMIPNEGPGLHIDDPNVLFFRRGYWSDLEHRWRLSAEDVKGAKSSCTHLNRKEAKRLRKRLNKRQDNKKSPKKIRMEQAEDSPGMTVKEKSMLPSPSFLNLTPCQCSDTTLSLELLQNEPHSLTLKCSDCGRYIVDTTPTEGDLTRTL